MNNSQQVAQQQPQPPLYGMGLPASGLLGAEETQADTLAQLRAALEGAQGQSNEYLQQGTLAANQAIQEGEGSALRALEQSTNHGVATLDPYAQTGRTSQQLAAALAGGLGADAQAKAIADFQSSPGQDFLRQRGEQAVLRNAAATGGTQGGNVLAELNRQGVGYANQALNDRIGQLTGLGAQGLSAAGQMANLHGQQGQTAAGIHGQGALQRAANQFNQGSMQSAGALGTSAQLANALQGIGAQQASQRYQTGQNLSAARATQANMLAQLAQQQGSGLSGLTGEQSALLAQLLSGAGGAEGQSLSNLAALLANISTGSGSQVAALPGIPGVSHNPGILGGLGQLAGGIGGLMTGIALSDQRLKENIRPLGQIGRYPIYQWVWNEQGRAIAGDQPTIGVLAQDIAHIQPDAVVRGEDGYLRVDYGRLV